MNLTISIASSKKYSENLENFFGFFLATSKICMVASFFFVLHVGDICTLDWVCLSLHFDNGTVAIVAGEEGGVDGGRHQDDSEVRVHPDHVPENNQNEISLTERVKG